jgi:hypothetical protein
MYNEEIEKLESEKQTITVANFRKRVRKLRETVCYPIINRGQLWYNKLTDEQYYELQNWYDAWLNVTETLVIPETPTWLNDKLSNEEEII